MAVGLVMFAGGDAGRHPALTAMRRVRQACARDTLKHVLRAGCFDPVVVAAADDDWTAALADLPVSIDRDRPDRVFRFGERFAEIVERYRLERVLYLGAASAPLLGAADFAQIADRVADETRAVVANNIYSTDWAAITPATIVVDWVDRLETDNALGWVLSNDAGLRPVAWPASPAARLDIDVPVDAQIAALHPGGGAELRQCVADLNWDTGRLQAVQRVLRTPASRLILAGRVPSWAWAQVEKATQCWTRVYSEERGMRAAGRLGAGQVRSLLNAHLQAVGLTQLLAEFASMADAMLWDTRVIWAAHGRWPAEIDRYAADLGRADWITDEFIREFTQAVWAAPLPIVTGGHALVSGGLWALLEAMANG
jgi:hypothetical protein